ncbi:ParE toxin of type II toxin-antitoxin system, parDE [Tenacibaculum sp. 190524A02b]|uniref:type II toxin-antitoxin system RelE/ParE family toxin n=1 Tax=Tenacibaculum vairaonense TaxID=3137860 RepID=UPI0032B25476
MSYVIKLLPVVYQDLQKAKQWYNEQKEGLGEEFKSEINKEFAYIKEYPSHYQKKYKDLRQSLTPRFPYAIFYLLEEDKKRIIVFGVLHTRRNPEVARERMK